MIGRRLKTIVLAGGPGINMRPLSDGIPKVLLKVAGKSIIDYPLSSLKETGITDITVVISDKMVEEYIESKWGRSLDISIVYQEKKGIEEAIKVGIEASNVRENVMIVYGDVITSTNAYSVVLDAYLSTNVDGVVLTVPLGQYETYGIILWENGLLKKIVEKPVTPQESSMAVGGVFILPVDIRDHFERGHTITEALNIMARERKIISAFWSGIWIDVGFPWDILEANRLILRQIRESRISSRATIENTAVIKGPIVVEDNAYIDHYAVIKGPAYIGPNTFIGMGSFIREFTSVEEGAVIGAHAEARRCSLQPESSIGSSAFIGDTVVGYKASIGPNVVTLNVLPSGVKISRVTPIRVRGKSIAKLGGIIGTEAKVGAGSILYPGAVIRAYSWIPPLSIIEREEL